MRQALIDAGISRVVCAIEDPNPEINGRGIGMLRAAGIEVHSGILADEARRLNEAFIVYKTEHRPFGILKIAMTLDAKIATRSGESRWITSEESRARVQTLRHQCDALITGSGTILADKPQLTDRTGLPRRRSLLRVILDRRGRISSYAEAFIFRDSLEALAAELYRREIQTFLLECGPDLAFSALKNGIIDKIMVFVAPRILGGREIPAIGGDGIEALSGAIRLRDWTVDRAGTDLVITAYVHRHH